MSLQAPSQHTPSTQLPVLHWEALLHALPVPCWLLSQPTPLAVQRWPGPHGVLQQMARLGSHEFEAHSPPVTQPWPFCFRQLPAWQARPLPQLEPLLRAAQEPVASQVWQALVQALLQQMAPPVPALLLKLHTSPARAHCEALLSALHA
jgi:hypothetical protein